MKLKYNDTGTFYRVTSEGYANTKIAESFEDVPIIFLQNTGFLHSRSQDAVTSDAICYVDPANEFISDNYNRLEGMYLKAAMFGATDAISWFKVESVTVNRDHLLTNNIDNIELRLKKTKELTL